MKLAWQASLEREWKEEGTLDTLERGPDPPFAFSYA